MSEEEKSDGGQYFTDNKVPDTFSSGCDVLDCAFGGGWGDGGRLINVAGDPSTNKSGLAIEAAANFLLKHPNASIYYAESEAAFDVGYAKSIGFPSETVVFPEVFVVEDVFEHLENEIIPYQKAQDNPRCLYIIDSLDALSDRGEMGRGIGDNSYGTEKSRQVSEGFRRTAQKLENSNVTLFVISQTRENLNAGYGSKKTRSGGKAMGFYASQIVWLSRVEKINKVIRGQTMPIGVKIRAQVTKNKIGPPFREATFPLYFSYGIDDLEANLTWLNSVKRLNRVSDKNGIKEAMKEIDQLSDEEFHEKREEIAQVTREEWQALEEQLKPKRSKYGSRRG